MFFLILAIIFSAIMVFYRLIIGPSVFDRIAAMNFIGVFFLTVLVLLSFYFERDIYINVALVFQISIFMNVLMMVKYFKKIEEEGEAGDEFT